MEISPMAEEKETQITDTFMQPEQPHEAMFLVLAYLPLFELISMARVCRSFRDGLKNDILPWLNIVVEKPLNLRISDDILLQIASKANGRLRTLALINCLKITDDGLQRVVARNPHIRQLYLPGCTRLSPGGVIGAVNLLAGNGNKLKRLKIYGIPTIKKDDLETLHHLMGENQGQEKKKVQHFYHKCNNNFSIWRHEETDPSNDVDICSKCNEVTMVFNCPRESCKRTSQEQLIECKACSLCIPRCKECGVCIKDEAVEAACPHILCLSCWLLLPKCNFCYKPYCKEHAGQQCRIPGSSGFLCEACYAKYVVYPDDI